MQYLVRELHLSGEKLLEKGQTKLQEERKPNHSLPLKNVLSVCLI